MAFDLNPFFYIEKYGDWSSSPNRLISPFACITVYSLCLQDQLIHYLYDTILIEILFSFLKMENKGLNVLINLGCLYVAYINNRDGTVFYFWLYKISKANMAISQGMR
jgi:hypothetical protein